MDKFKKNKDFSIEFTLQYDDTSTVIDLDDVTDISVIIKHEKTGQTLVTKTYLTSGVSIITANSGICAVYINKTDTVNARSGLYIYEVTVTVANSNFTGSDAEHCGFDNAFVLE